MNSFFLFNSLGNVSSSYGEDSFPQEVDSHSINIEFGVFDVIMNTFSDPSGIKSNIYLESHDLLKRLKGIARSGYDIKPHLVFTLNVHGNFVYENTGFISLINQFSQCYCDASYTKSAPYERVFFKGQYSDLRFFTIFDYTENILVLIIANSGYIITTLDLIHKARKTANCDEKITIKDTLYYLISPRAVAKEPQMPYARPRVVAVQTPYVEFDHTPGKF